MRGVLSGIGVVFSEGNRAGGGRRYRSLRGVCIPTHFSLTDSSMRNIDDGTSNGLRGCTCGSKYVLGMLCHARVLFPVPIMEVFDPLLR